MIYKSTWEKCKEHNKMISKEISKIRKEIREVEKQRALLRKQERHLLKQLLNGGTYREFNHQWDGGDWDAGCR